MTPDRHLVVLGGGLAAHSAAVAARHNGYEGRITILSDETYPPYDRTPLSKAVLQGKRETDELGFQPNGDYSGDEIEFVSGASVATVDFRERGVKTTTGERLGFDHMLIATGASPIRLSGPGCDLEGVHYLRTINDARAIQEDLARASRVFVIGAGFIGSEVAASARMLGKEVTLADMAPAPMHSALHPDLSSICAGIHRDHGVDLRMGVAVSELQGTARVEQAGLEDGSVVECDLVVVGIGVQPNVELFTGTDLRLENGVVADEYCRTSVPGVFAAGDVANWWHPEIQQRVRIEHYDNAGSQGTHAGKVIAGADAAPFAPLPYFWSDQYDTNIQYAGFPAEDCELVLRGNPEERRVTGFYVRDGALCAAVTINQAREFRSARRLVAARARIDPGTLRDPDTDIRKLSREYR